MTVVLNCKEALDMVQYCRDKMAQSDEPWEWTAALKSWKELVLDMEINDIHRGFCHVRVGGQK